MREARNMVIGATIAVALLGGVVATAVAYAGISPPAHHFSASMH